MRKIQSYILLKSRNGMIMILKLEKSTFIISIKIKKILITESVIKGFSQLIF